MVRSKQVCEHYLSSKITLSCIISEGQFFGLVWKKLKHFRLKRKLCNDIFKAIFHAYILHDLKYMKELQKWEKFYKFYNEII